MSQTHEDMIRVADKPVVSFFDSTSIDLYQKTQMDLAPNFHGMLFAYSAFGLLERRFVPWYHATKLLGDR